MMNQHKNYILRQLALAGLNLKPYTVVNKEQLYSTDNKNYKVTIDFSTMQVEVISFGEVPYIVDRGFYIDPRNAACAAARIMKKIGINKEVAA